MESQPAIHRYPAAVRRHRPMGSVGQRRLVDRLAPSTQEVLDRITSLAGEALDVPAVCVALVDAERRLLASSYGLPVPTALLLSHAFRRPVIASRRPLPIGVSVRERQTVTIPVWASVGAIVVGSLVLLARQKRSRR